MIQILEFEKEIFALENEIQRLLSLSHMIDSVGDISHEIAKLRKKERRLKHEVFSNLNGWQKTQVARHRDRPHSPDYIQGIFTDFVELNGDRHGGFGPSITGGLAKFGDQSIVVLGNQKGRSNEEKILRNFGMPQPEDYRKARRLMALAEKFNLPIVAFIDTPGAYPGIDAEEKGQSEAIAGNLAVMATLRVPLISIVIGEGGSGGALAIGMGNRILMLEHSIYSVISPEGCASILWGNKEKVVQAADALCLTAQDLLKLKMIDGVIMEPLGGAHRHPKRTVIAVKKALRATLNELLPIPAEELIKTRQEKFRNLGVYEELQAKDS